MKALLRQDPDVILVWEVRDKITMTELTTASTTWHLCFSSLHTNDCWATLTRLNDIWFDLNTVGSVIRLIVAQRLWQSVCPKCIKEFDDPIFSNNDPIKQKEREEEYLKRKIYLVKKLVDSPYIMDLPDNLQDLKFYEWEGWNCTLCRGKKTKWRLWITEFLPITLQVEDFILKKWLTATKDMVRELYISEWIETLHQNALSRSFIPTKTMDWNLLFMDYEKWINGAWWDVYEFWMKYEWYTIAELNALIKKRKVEHKLKEIKNEILRYNSLLEADRNSINDFNKSEKEKNILWYTQKIEELQKTENEYKEFLLNHPLKNI
jgi:hypothetical protein